MSIVKVHKKGIVVLPKKIREAAGIKEGMKLIAEVEGGKIILRPVDLWWRVWECAKGLGSAEEVEEELDEEEKSWEERFRR